MKFRARQSARQNASRLLPLLAERFFRSGDAALKDRLRGADLHRFRIRTKRFRFVLEYFRPCYGQALDVYIEAVRGLQSALGDLTDTRSTRLLLQELLQAGDPPVRHKKLLAALEAAGQELLGTYQAYWREWLESPDFRQKFLRYLRHPPRDRRKGLGQK